MISMIPAEPLNDDWSSGRERLPADTRVLTVDLGTSYFKVGLFNPQGELELLQTVPAPSVESANGRVELDVAALQNSIASAVREIASEAGNLDSVRAVGFATQANSFALFDDSDRALMPFILWSDCRARDETAFIKRLSTLPGFYQTTGIAQLNHLYLPAKLSWLRRQDPELLESATRIALVSDYFTWWVTGQWTTEGSVAGLTGLANIHTLQWWQDACSILQLPIQKLPPIVRAGTTLGRITPQIAAEWGLRPDCVLVAGCLDQFAGAIGAGALQPGAIVETTGTVLATVMCAENFKTSPNAAVFQGPAYRKGLYFQMSFSELSAGILDRYRKARYPDHSFSLLDQIASTAASGAARLRVRSDAFHRPIGEIFEGRTELHTRAHEIRAILEAVAEELRRQVRLLTENRMPSRVVSAGGAARSELWQRIKSETLGCPVVTADCRESASRGAALLAISGLSGIPVEELTLNDSRKTRTLRPDALR